MKVISISLPFVGVGVLENAASWAAVVKAEGNRSATAMVKVAV